MSRRKQPKPLTPETCFGDGQNVSAFLEQFLGEKPQEAKILNYRGQLSLFVEGSGRRYKVSECESEERAVLAEMAMQAVYETGGPMPRLYARSGAVLVTEWGEGAPCLDEPFERRKSILLQCQAALCRTPVPENSNPAYVHLETLTRRFRRLGPRIASRARIEKVIEHLWSKLPEPESPQVLHPDLTAANIVIGEKGPIIIDNEAMAVGCGVEFDVWNTGEALCGHRNHDCIHSYADAFSEQFPETRLLSEEPVWTLFRQFRRMLKAIEKKRFIKALILMNGLSS